MDKNAMRIGLIIFITGHPEGNKLLSPAVQKIGSVFVGEHSIALAAPKEGAKPNTPALARSLANDHLPDRLGELIANRSDTAMERTVRMPDYLFRICSVTISWHRAAPLLKDASGLKLTGISEFEEGDPVKAFLSQAII